MRGAVPCLCLVATFWVVRYWHSSDFGLYEDDYSHLPAAASMSTGEAVAFAIDPQRILTLGGNGHPLHYTFIYLLTNLGWRVAGLHGPYLAGFVVETLNICLLFWLVERIHSRPLAILVALVYVLYSADTTQAYLTLSLGLHPSITLFLLAGHLHLSRCRWLAYVVAALMLLTYETTFTAFFAFPLLLAYPRGRWLKETASHVLVLVALLAAATIWRMAVGDNRLVGLRIRDAALTPLLHMVEGPPVSLGTYLYRPIQSLQAMNTEVALVAFLVAGAFALTAWRLSQGTPSSITVFLAQIRAGDGVARRFWITICSVPPELGRLLRICVAGYIMLVLAYPLTFTVRAYAISGRDTRVHAAGAIGAAVVVGTLVLIILWIAKATHRRALMIAPLAVWLGLLAGYGMVIQSDYVHAWEYQKAFWAELVPLLPDVSDGTVVLVEPWGLKDTRQIHSNHWSLPITLEQLYQFPAAWDSPPRVYLLKEDWTRKAMDVPGVLVIDEDATHPPADTFKTADPANAILIKTVGGTLNRVSEVVSPSGQTIDLRPLPTQWGEPPYEPGFLWRYLLAGSSASPSGG
ncbi:MAG: hypothetical protein MUO35_11165 [Anaerolineales bacterium]|nr:hypothetical protein [Anaerolineales bacterium]